MAVTTAPQPPPPFPELTSILSALSAFAHRNKNQHRLSKWWKTFSQLRRQVSSLVSELAECHKQETRYGAGHRKSAAARGAVESRAGFMVKELVPRAYLSFTTLVADNQYAPLGMMLLATLARVRKLILPLEGDAADEIEEEAIQSALDGIEKSGLDLGEVIQRDEISKAQENEERPHVGSEVKKRKDKKRERKGDEDEARSKTPAESTPTKRPKKKRKKGDAFDDIFGSLI